MKITSVRGIK